MNKTKLSHNMSYKSDKIKKALEAKGYTEVKVWYDKPTVAFEKCGNVGGWMFAWTECDEDFLGYNFDAALKAVKKMDLVANDNSYDDTICVCGHKRFSHNENGCEVFIDTFFGDCPCCVFIPV